MRAAFTIDGVHPNAAGYAAMAPVAEAALARALAAPAPRPPRHRVLAASSRDQRRAAPRTPEESPQRAGTIVARQSPPKA